MMLIAVMFNDSKDGSEWKSRPPCQLWVIQGWVLHGTPIIPLPSSPLGRALTPPLCTKIRSADQKEFRQHFFPTVDSVRSWHVKAKIILQCRNKGYCQCNDRGVLRWTVLTGQPLITQYKHKHGTLEHVNLPRILLLIP